MRLKRELVKGSLTIEGATFQVQELGTTMLTEVSVAGIENKAHSLRATFVAAVTGWTGITDEDGATIDYSDENKVAIFEANHTLVEKFMVAYPKAIEESRAGQKKISPIGVSAT